MTKNRTQLLLVFGIAFASLGGAYLLFFLASGGAGWGTSNHGELVDPPQQIADFGWMIVDPEKGELPVQQPGKWWLWLVVDRCEADCRQALNDLRALHVLLNRQAERVRRGFTVLAGSQASGPPDSELVDVIVTAAEPARRGIYLVDPLGNLVLYYALTADPAGMLEDLKHLLKLSQIG